MAVVLLIVAAVIVGGVAVVAVGRGGEMAHFDADIPPLSVRTQTAAGRVRLRPAAAQREPAAGTAAGEPGQAAVPGTDATADQPLPEAHGRPEATE